MIHSFLESILLGEQTSKIFPKLVLLTNKHLDEKLRQSLTTGEIRTKIRTDL